jgi:hypothetical protein
MTSSGPEPDLLLARVTWYVHRVIQTTFARAASSGLSCRWGWPGEFSALQPLVHVGDASLDRRDTARAAVDTRARIVVLIAASSTRALQ